MAYKLITALRYEEQLDSILHYVACELHNKTAAKLIYKDVREAYKFLREFPTTLRKLTLTSKST